MLIVAAGIALVFAGMSGYFALKRWMRATTDTQSRILLVLSEIAANTRRS